MKKFLSLLMIFCLCLSCCVLAHAEEGEYVLMNIPFADFYANEGVAVTDLDAVSSATMAKTRVEEQAGGSYHVNPDGSEVNGVIFPVYVSDPAVLETLGGMEITDLSSVDITVSLKGNETTTTFSGREALFEAPDYSWYVLPADEVPAQYKTLTVDGDPSFSAVNTEAQEIAAEAAFYFDSHIDLAIKVKNAAELDDANVSAVILIADDGTRVAMRHMANIHKKFDIGFNLDSAEYEALKGKTLTGIQVLTQNGNYLIPVDLAVVDDEVLALLNGTYIDLFPEFAKEEYHDYWIEQITSYGPDEETAELYYVMLTQTYMGRLKGEEAIEAYGDNPESMLFDCYLENGVAKVVVNGDVISAIDANGDVISSHHYAYLQDEPVLFFGMDTGTSLHVYKTEDEDAGMFTYYAFSDDNLRDTQHIEFRYGENLENIANYSEGEYAYWLASGIQDGYKDKLIQTCISLFVSENVGGEEEAAA